MTEPGSQTVRILALTATATVTVLVMCLVFARGAAAIPSDAPDETWGVNGRVSATLQVGNVIYVGGKFTEVRSNGGEGPDVLPRSYLAAFDATTGAPTGWAPSANGEVYALAASPDGDRIYVGGRFTAVNGLTRSRVAAITADGGFVESWKAPSISSSVWTLAATADRLYVGGAFGSVGGAARRGLVALSPTTAAVDTGWVPTTDSTVRTLALSPDGSRVYAGGDFTMVNGVARGNVAALSSAGVVDPAWNPDPGEKVFGLVTDGSSVYAAIGGAANDVASWDAATGSVRWVRHSDGDFQAIALAKDVVYAGGRFNNFEGELRRKLVAVDAATGALRRAWRPSFPSGTGFEGGVWALSTNGTTRLAVGGDFDGISGVHQSFYAQFTGSLANPTGDSAAPSRPGSLSAVAVAHDRVDLSWSASEDDDAVAYYRIFRDASQVATSEKPVYTDASVSARTTYSYHVVAVDFAGNASAASSTSSVTTPGRTVFRDGFETDNLSLWTKVTGLTVEQASAAAGTWAARANTTSGARYAYRRLASTHRELSYELRFKLLRKGSSTVPSLLKFKTASGGKLMRLHIEANGTLGVRNDVTGVTTTSLSAVTTGWWNTVRVRLLVNGTASRVEVSLNGTPVAELSKIDSYGTTEIGRVQVGEDSSGKSYDLLFDEVAVDAPPVNTEPPTVSGTARDGETLTAQPGSWSGSEPSSYAYQWLRCDAGGMGCVDIAGATGQTHTLSGADVDSTVRVQVTASNAAGEGAAVSAPTPAVVAAPPVSAQPPSVSGMARDGETLTADRGAWSGTEPIAYAYQWLRCDAAGGGCAEVAAAHGRTYEVTGVDIGATLRVRVTGSNAADSSAVVSAPTQTVTAAPPVNTEPPSVSGVALDGETLAADVGSWSGSEPMSHGYQWRRCDAAGEACADIADATGQSYRLTAADVGSKIRVRVTASNAADMVAADSQPGAVVGAVAPTNIAAPVISGTARGGETLSADAGSWSGTDPISYAYQWQACTAGACADIAAATGQTYTLSDAEVGTQVRVLVTATNQAGSRAVASDQTEAVAPTPPEAGLTLSWSDEFERAAGAPPDPTSWTHQTGGKWSGGAELQCYTTRLQNSSHDGHGNLQIVARNETFACDSSTNSYTSARINTKGKREFQYGYIEARLKAPTGKGIWPAFWTLGADPGLVWPANGEIDIFEAIGSEPDTIHQTIHGPTESGAHWMIPLAAEVPAWSEQFHDYGVKWTAEGITFYVDDVAIRTLTAGDLRSDWRWVFDRPNYLLLNVAVGGTWPGSPDSTTPWPATMLVDYVRVYQ